MSDRFSAAMAEWEDGSGPETMIGLLMPFCDYALLDLEESCQKGCDCGGIEIMGNFVCPYDDRESGDAIMLLLEWIRSAYRDVQIAAIENAWTVACFKGPGSLDGPLSSGHGTLIGAVLEIVCTDRFLEDLRAAEASGPTQDQPR